jgi:competence protein ComEA
MSEPADHPPEPSPFWLRAPDQPVIAAAVLVGLSVLAYLWIAQGGPDGRLIDIERQPSREVPFQLDINTADWPELALLPKVGPTLAQRIVESRRDHGPFDSIEDLRRVRGIGPKTLDGMRPYLKPLSPGLAPPGAEPAPAAGPNSELSRSRPGS